MLLTNLGDCEPAFGYAFANYANKRDRGEPRLPLGARVDFTTFFVRKSLID